MCSSAPLASIADLLRGRWRLVTLFFTFSLSAAAFEGGTMALLALALHTLTAGQILVSVKDGGPGSAPRVEKRVQACPAPDAVDPPPLTLYQFGQLALEYLRDIPDRCAYAGQPGGHRLHQGDGYALAPAIAGHDTGEHENMGLSQ